MSAMSYLVHLTPRDCEDHLARTTMGRLGVVVDGRPEIFPVNHGFDAESGSVVFATNTSTKFNAIQHWPWVAYEVDGLDPDNDWAWSVLVVGRAEEITDEDEVARLRPLRQGSWVTREEMRWVRIIPSKITGRRVGPQDNDLVEDGSSPGLV